MQVFLCSGWTENLRKWEILVPNCFCEFVDLRVRQRLILRNQLSLSRPDILGPEFSPVKPMSCELVFGFGVGFVSSFSPQSHPWHRPPCEGCWGQSTALSPKLCTNHVGLWALVFQALGWREEEEDGWNPAALLQDFWQLLLKSCSAVATVLSWIYLPTLTNQNNKYLCSLQAPKHENRYKWFVCNIEAPLYISHVPSPVETRWKACDTQSLSWKCPQTPLGEHKAGSWAPRCTALWLASFLYI